MTSFEQLRIKNRTPIWWRHEFILQICYLIGYSVGHVITDTNTALPDPLTFDLFNLTQFVGAPNQPEWHRN